MQSRPIIQEKAVIADKTIVDNQFVSPIGEAFTSDNIPDKPMDARLREMMVSRLEKTITDLMHRTAQTYEANCHKAGSSEVDPNYIARLSTHEFFFYTREPLTLEEFGKLQNKIAEEAKKYPSGVQLILGSFAVKTEDNRVMNVVPYLTCGEKPEFHFIVKNSTSPIDVRYNIPDGKGNTTLLKPLDKMTHDPAKPLPGIEINGTMQDFTFNNIIRCKTPGGTTFLTAVDICLDHQIGVAKTNLEKLTDIQNIPVSQVVLSNSIRLEALKCLVKDVMHVDPYCSPQECRKDAMQKKVSSYEKFAFGRDPVSVYDLDKYPLTTLKEEYDAVKKVFISQLGSIGFNVLNQSPLRLQFNQESDGIRLKNQLDKHGILYNQTTGNTLEIHDNVFARAAIVAIGTDLLIEIKQALEPAFEWLCYEISGISNPIFALHGDNTLLPIQLSFQNQREANIFITALKTLNPAFAASTEVVTTPKGKIFVSCDLELLTDQNFLGNVIAYYQKASQNTDVQEKKQFGFFQSSERSDTRTGILKEFKDILMQINTAEEMQAFKDNLKDINHENHAKFKMLASNPLQSDEKTLHQMIEERELLISQGNVLKF